MWTRVWVSPTEMLVAARVADSARWLEASACCDSSCVKSRVVPPLWLPPINDSPPVRMPPTTSPMLGPPPPPPPADGVDVVLSRLLKFDRSWLTDARNMRSSDAYWLR